jgi:TolB-like protein
LKEELATPSPNAPPTDARLLDGDTEPGGETLAQIEKRKSKVRTAWISFMGRVVAQVVGAAATIIFGLLLVQKYHAAPAAPAPNATPSSRARGQTDPHMKSLAVLPLEDYSTSPQSAQLVNGLTEELISQLAQTERLRVISRTSSMRYRDVRKPLPEIARDLNVDWIVEGSLTVAGARARLTAQLIDANTDEHVWVRSYDRTLADPLSLQVEIAATVTADLAAVLSPVRPDTPARPLPGGSTSEPCLQDRRALVADTR